MAESSSSQEKPAEQSKFDQDNIPKPSKMLLLRAERDILINDMIREKAKEEVKYCFNHFAEMSKCQQEHGIVSGLWKCTEENKGFKMCMQWAFYDEELRDSCKNEYVQRKREAVQKNKEQELENQIRLKVIDDWMTNQNK
ncbi:COX assembly mitochondrial protein homolog [Bolinopsis microptera]|uniref:COX assembly mitochondrial protein homolog n=1 Tax=Bolinopsis microptera TaxID=2820187 RepID=UPI0030796FC2